MSLIQPYKNSLHKLLNINKYSINIPFLSADFGVFHLQNQLKWMLSLIYVEQIKTIICYINYKCSQYYSITSTSTKNKTEKYPTTRDSPEAMLAGECTALNAEKKSGLESVSSAFPL